MSLSRPGSVGTLGMSRSGSLNTLTLSASGSQSGLGYQVRSTRPSSSAYSFNRYATGRDKLAKIYPGSVVDPLYRGQEQNRHFIPDSPAPVAYTHALSLGKQTLSKAKTAAAFSFGTTGRFAYLEQQAKMSKTPGPGSYAS
jgi:hypothetical protein